MTLPAGPPQIHDRGPRRTRCARGIPFGLCFLFLPIPCIAADPPAAGSLVSRIVERAPVFEGYDYKCADMVWVVNELRKAGKDEAIRALKQYVDETAFGERKPQRDSLFLICRCLFEKPGGWTPPTLGAPAPTIQKSALTKLPVFPIGYSNGVPFMLISSYRLGGVGENPRECIKLCESLPMRDSDLRAEGFEAAARALVSSAEFAELYPDAKVRSEMSEMILAQARQET